MRLKTVSRLTVTLLILLAGLPAQESKVFAQRAELDDVQLRASVLQTMQNGTAWLRATQQDDGSWQGRGVYASFTTGTTSIALLALINCDVPAEAPEIQRGLAYLRNLTVEGVQGSAGVYETSLAIMALCAAEQFDRDLPRIQLLASLLERSQTRQGPGAGYWGYQLNAGGGGPGGGDASNGQYAVLALREAVLAGAKVSRETWQLIEHRWLQDQQPNGGWGYSDNDRKTRGSMTAAGLATIAITSRMLQTDADCDAEGRPDCCGGNIPGDAMSRGRRWMAENFSVATNPGHNDYYFYYMYGLERAGRMANVRWFGQHDWYRRGAQQLVQMQQPGGNWTAQTASDHDEIVNTSMALIFLSKGLSRVVINKLDYNSPPGESSDIGEWNRHPWDVVSLVDLVETLPRWPPRMTSQVITLSRLKAASAVEELSQSPILFLSGRDAPVFTDEQIEWLRRYVDSGGFILASACCDGRGFDTGIREIVKRMFPDGSASLQKLQGDHPVFRSEYLLNAEGIDLWGVDFGCRTSIIYSPDDLGCLWQKWMKHEPPNRNPDLTQRILRATRIGVNVMAYATGREPPEKLSETPNSRRTVEDRIERGLLQIARIRPSGGWDTAPRAARNLLQALNDTVGVAASTQVEAIPPTLEELTRFPLTCMHGRYRFQLPVQQQDALREYLKRGGVLFADACCGSTQFDRSFRDLARQLFPNQELKIIPPDHELYAATTGHEIREVTRRRLVPGELNAALTMQTEKGAPLLEGVEIDGRLAIIYSRHDISCALEHQASLSCDGYIEEDAARLAVNVVLYSMLQDISWSRFMQAPPESAKP